MPLDQTPQTPEPPVIETASATTSPDNANSGPLAYVVFGIVIALLVLLGAGLSSCGSMLSSLADEDAWGYVGEDYPDNLPGNPDGYENVEDLLREWHSGSPVTDPRFDS